MYVGLCTGSLFGAKTHKIPQILLQVTRRAIELQITTMLAVLLFSPLAVAFSILDYIPMFSFLFALLKFALLKFAL